MFPVEYILNDANWPNYSIHVGAQREDYARRATRGKEESKAESGTEGGEESEDASLKKIYRNCMTKDRVYGTFQELNAASDLFQFNLVVVRQLGLLQTASERNKFFYNILSFKDTFTWPTTHHFLFSGHGPNGGHFEYLEPTSPTA